MPGLSANLPSAQAVAFELPVGQKVPAGQMIGKDDCTAQEYPAGHRLAVPLDGVEPSSEMLPDGQ